MFPYLGQIDRIGEGWRRRGRAARFTAAVQRAATSGDSEQCVGKSLLHERAALGRIPKGFLLVGSARTRKTPIPPPCQIPGGSHE
jgi:hypothetical protein